MSLKNLVYKIISKIKIIKLFTQNIYSLLSFKVSYAQCGEDLIILEYLKSQNINKGKYLDIGAFHPIYISNTYLLHKNNFFGYVVDLDEEKLDNFKFYRGSKVKIILSAITNSYQKIIKVYKFKKKILPSEYDTASLDFANYVQTKFKINYITENIKNTHINDLFKSVGKIDFLNLDLEGLEFECLLSADLNLINPAIIVVKYRKYNQVYDEKINNYFEKNNYKFLVKSGLFLGYAKFTNQEDTKII